MASAGRDQRRFQAAILGCVAGVMGECEQERLAGCSERPGVRYREPFIRAARKREDERARSVACAMRGNAKAILCRATRVQERRGARRATARSAAAPATMEAEEETREHGRGRDWSWTRLVVPLRLDTLRLQQRHGPPAAMHPARFCLATGLTGTTLASQRARKGWRPYGNQYAMHPSAPGGCAAFSSTAVLSQFLAAVRLAQAGRAKTSVWFFDRLHCAPIPASQQSRLETFADSLTR
jgi:hypothetical protein